jgi:hypothetical protein
VRIRGVGPATILVSPAGVFTLTNCVDCTLEDLAIVSATAATATTAAVALTGTVNTTLQRLTLLAMGQIGSTGVSLDGLQATLTIRDNFVIGSVGITTPAPGKTPGGLLAVGMRIESNTLHSSNTAVLLQGQAATATSSPYLVAFASGARITNNSISPSTAGAGNGITVMGPMLGGGSLPNDGSNELRIEGNQLQVAGTGIATTASNCRVTANTIALSAGASPSTTAVGISVGDQPIVAQTGTAAIDNNTVTGLPAGISVGPQFAAVDVSHNQVQLGASPAATAGVLSVDGTGNKTFAAVSITDNSLNGGVVNVKEFLDLKFSGNNVTTAETTAAAVVLSTSAPTQGGPKLATLRCEGNLVRGGKPSISITGTANGSLESAVLGNITTSTITPPLPAAWLQLNIQGAS